MAAEPEAYKVLQSRLDSVSNELRELGVIASSLSEEHVRYGRIKSALWDAMGAIDNVRSKVFLHQKQDRRARRD